MSRNTLSGKKASSGQWIQPSGDCLEEIRGGLPCLQGGELRAEFNDRGRRAGIAESFISSGGSGHFSAEEDEVEAADAHQNEAIAQIVAGVDVVSGAAQEFPKINHDVGVAIDAQDTASGGAGLFEVSGRAIEGGDSVVLAIVTIEELGEVRHVEDFTEMIGDIAEFEVAFCLPGATERADHGSQAAAVDEGQLSEMEDDGAPVAQQVGDVGTKGFGFGAGDEASLAADDGDASDVAGFES